METMVSYSGEFKSIDFEVEFDDELGCAEAHPEQSQRASSQKVLQQLVQREAKAVQCWRLLTFSCMTIAAAAVSVGVFTYLRNTQTRDFENGFEANALQLVESFNNKAAQKLEVLNPLATDYTSYALSRNLTFPFITLPDFIYRASNAQVLGKDVQIRYISLLFDDETRLQWEEEFALQNRFHLLKAYDIELANIAKEDAIYKTSSNADRRKLQESGEDCAASATCSSTTSQENINQTETSNTTALEATNATNSTNNTLPFELEDGYITRIWDGGTTFPYESAPYFPLWQLSPITPDRLLGYLNDNFVTAQIFTPVGLAILQDHRAAVGPFMIPNPDGTVAQRLEANLQMSQFRYDMDAYRLEPASYIAVPVFDSFSDDRKLVGMVTSSVYWRVNFMHVLPSDAVGYVVVLKNSFGQTVSYRVEGATNITFLAEEDLHDPSYDDLVVTANMNKFIEERASIRTKAYTSVGLNPNVGVVEMFVYPSRETERSYRDSSPVYTALAMAAIFVVTIIAFFLYDRLLEQKQALIMDTAIKSSVIVESLFPKQVHSRLYETMNTTTNNIKEWQKTEALELNTTSMLDTSSAKHDHSIPIADAFPNTTILFADVVGFSEWSSNRKPREVFVFLEALFREFDKLAERRNVFKVETIGDSYLAATGVPEPQADHEVRMAKFAQAMLAKASKVITAFGNSLDTKGKNLKIRIGINSGPITAGILRGQKSRFQIFGDTVNTASRMESTCVGGHIQVSQSTAEGLIQAGHSDWIRVREDKVFAKGKGYLTTYWMKPCSSKSTGTASLEDLEMESFLEPAMNSDGSILSDMSWSDFSEIGV